MPILAALKKATAGEVYSKKYGYESYLFSPYEILTPEYR